MLQTGFLRQFGQCILCGCLSSPGICRLCMRDLPINHPACPVCARPTPTAVCCGRCLTDRPKINQTLAAFSYSYPLDQLIHRIKFHQALNLLAVLGQLLAGIIMERKIVLPEVIIPVPLHPSRQIERGFNQALLLAKTLSRRINCPIDSRLCKRVVNTTTQTTLTARDRRRNLKGAFKICHQHAYRHVVIIDDVVTTGATSMELCKGLMTSGIQRIDLWTLARTERHY